LSAFPFLGDAASLESVPDLVKAMYLNIESFPCVRLLNLSGEIGCSSETSLSRLHVSVCLNSVGDHFMSSLKALLC
jgi:nicastrin